MYRGWCALAPRQSRRLLNRHSVASRIVVFFPSRSSCIRRNSMRPGYPIESGARRSVFYFCFTQTALGFHRTNNLAHQLLRAILDQALALSGLPVDRHSVNAH